MDFPESTRIVYGRIKQLEPELASKIVGYLLLQEHGDREMIRLAFGPDNVIHFITNKVKNELSLLTPKPSLQSPSFISPQLAQLRLPPFSSAMALHPSDNAYHWNSQIPTANHQQLHNVELLPPIYMDSVAQDHCLHNQMPFFSSLDDRKESVNPTGYEFFGTHGSYADPSFDGFVNSRTNPTLNGGSELPVKVCHYFSKGFCKHGSSCRYFHGNPSGTFFNEDQMELPRSLEKLERELTELLRSRNGTPVSIAMLPMRYYERYGKALQAEGYLTESQRHGKAGYSLTKLLARMKSSIRLIDRAHGQHAVILAKDLPKYLEYASEQGELGGGGGDDVSISDRQIYLTFPAESTFSEKDVSNYFSGYGPVQDVRIPNLQQRMYGFVTFVYAETVRKILAIGNPHFVCNSRVLVKPYKEKSKLNDRKISQRKHQAHCGSKYMDGDSELQHGPRMFRSPRTIRKHFMEQYEPHQEFESRRLELMSRSRLSCPSSIGYSMAGLKLTETCDEQAEFPTKNRLNFLFDIPNTGSNNEERARCSDSSANDQESDEGINLPESPFATSVANSI